MRKLYFVLLGMLLSVCTSCSDSDEGGAEIIEPSVAFSELVAGKEISVTITPENAVGCGLCLRRRSGCQTLGGRGA